MNARIRCAVIVAGLVGLSACESGPAEEYRSPEVDREHVNSRSQKIFGPDVGPDNVGNTFLADTVVQLTITFTSGAGGCSGTLITPSVVLTAAHCFGGGTVTSIDVDVGAYKYPGMAGGQIRISASNHVLYGDGVADETVDVALVYLDRPAFALADSRRPMVWSWAPGPFSMYGDSLATFGIAGYSVFSDSTTGCGTGNVDSSHTDWRQSCQGMHQDWFNKILADAPMISWSTDNADRVGLGDSGGPLFHIAPDGGREVIGVSSRINCIDGYEDQEDLYVDVTGGDRRDWIVGQLSDSRSPDWLSRHGRTDHWVGEVDYVGPCTAPENGNIDPNPQIGATATQDLDCDHWYDIHDDCPLDYNPGQEEDASGHGIACNGRGTIPYDPSNPADTSVDLDPAAVCKTDQPNCPIGFYAYTEIKGQFWQLQTGSGQPLTPPDGDWRGSYLHIYESADAHWHPSGAQRIDEHTGEHWPPPQFDTLPLALRDIKSLHDPDRALCTISSYDDIVWGGAPSILSRNLPANGLSVLSYLVGNVGRFGTEIPSPEPFVQIQNASPHKALQNRDLHRPNDGVTVGTVITQCPNWTPKYYDVDFQVTATSSTVTRPLVFAGPDVNTTFCFLSGLEGAWGGWSATNSLPMARIDIDPGGNKRITVTPSPSSNQPVSAWVTCLDLTE